MFFVTYLRRELRRRMRQAIVIALGLAVGIGLVVTVSAAVDGSEARPSPACSRALYGVGTDVTVTATARAVQPGPRRDPDRRSGRAAGGSATAACHSRGGQTVDNLASPAYGPLGRLDGRLGRPAARRGQRRRRPHAQRHPDQDPGLDRLRRAPARCRSRSPSAWTAWTSSTVRARPAQRGQDHRRVGTCARSDASSDVAVVDSDYAAAHQLKVGSTITIDKKASRSSASSASRRAAARPTSTSRWAGPRPSARARQQEAWTAR